MKVFISADIEGCVGVTSWNETLQSKEGYEAARQQMTAEVYAACKAAVDLGYEVTVKDGHENALNLRAGDLPVGTTLIRGWMTSPDAMMAGLDETYDGAIYIGYHAPEGTSSSPLAHTIEHDIFNWIKINGQLASEFTINSIVASKYKVPSIFISGDQEACDSAKREEPNIVTVPTKYGVGGATVNRHPQEVVDEIYEGVKKALTSKIDHRKIEEKYVLTMNFKEHTDARKAGWYPKAKLIDSNTVEYEAQTIEDFAIARMFMNN